MSYRAPEPYPSLSHTTSSKWLNSTALLYELSDLIPLKHLAECLAYSNPWINTGYFNVFLMHTENETTSVQQVWKPAGFEVDVRSLSPGQFLEEFAEQTVRLIIEYCYLSSGNGPCPGSALLPPLKLTQLWPFTNWLLVIWPADNWIFCESVNWQIVLLTLGWNLYFVTNFSCVTLVKLWNFSEPQMSFLISKKQTL